MLLPRTTTVVAIGLALVIGLVVFVPMASAGHNPAALDKYLQAIFGCNESNGGTATLKSGKEVQPRVILACKLQAERRYWKDVNKEFHKDILGK
jgi:hypothetical protein